MIIDAKALSILDPTNKDAKMIDVQTLVIPSFVEDVVQLFHGDANIDVESPFEDKVFKEPKYHSLLQLPRFQK